MVFLSTFRKILKADKIHHHRLFRQLIVRLSSVSHTTQRRAMFVFGTTSPAADSISITKQNLNKGQ